MSSSNNNYIPALIQQRFLSPPFTRSMIELVVIRRTILEAVKSVLPSLNGTVLDIGCGYQPYKSLFLSAPSKAVGYIGMDLRNNSYLLDGVDLVWDGQSIPLPDKSIDCAIATEFFEHSSSPAAVLREILRVLKPGGLLFLTVPFLWPLHEVPNDEYRYTPFSLERALRGAGFSDIRLTALGGTDAALAIMIGIWASRVRERVLGRIARSLAVPIIRFLYKIDRKPSSFSDDTMITGLSGLARKLEVVPE